MKQPSLSCNLRRQNASALVSLPDSGRPNESYIAFTRYAKTDLDKNFTKFCSTSLGIATNNATETGTL